MLTSDLYKRRDDRLDGFVDDLETVTVILPHQIRSHEREDGHDVMQHMVLQYIINLIRIRNLLLVSWLCLTSHRQRSQLETAPRFTVPCEGRDARFLHHLEPRVVVWQSITQPLCHASSKMKSIV